MKKLAPRKALGPFDLNPGLPTDLRDDINDQSAPDDGLRTKNNLSGSGLLVTSGLAEDAQVWVPVKGSVAPLDLSLKLLARFTSSDSLHWLVQLTCFHSLLLVFSTWEDHPCEH